MKHVDVVVTHAWMDKKRDHIANSEIRAFVDIIKKAFKKSSVNQSVKQIDSNYSSVPDEFDLVIFWSSLSLEKSLYALAQQARRVFIVIPDPNWTVDVQIGRDYIVMTPFEALDGSDDYAEKLKTLCDIHVDDAESHVFIPFGEMAFHNNRYMNLFDASHSPRNVPSLPWRRELAYAGSMKNTRAKTMSTLACEGVLDLYGNIKKEEIASYLTHEQRIRAGAIQSLNESIRGHVPPMSVWRIYQEYDHALFISDPLMLELRTHYMRPLELALAGCKVTFAGDDPDVTDRSQELMSDLFIDDSSNRASIKKLRESYDMDMINRVSDAILL